MVLSPGLSLSGPSESHSFTLARISKLSYPLCALLADDAAQTW